MGRDFKKDALRLGCVSNPHFGQLEPLSKKLAGPRPDFSHVDLAMSQLILSFEDDSLSKPRFLIIPVSATRDFTTESAKPSQDFLSRFEHMLSIALAIVSYYSCLCTATRTTRCSQ